MVLNEIHLHENLTSLDVAGNNSTTFNRKHVYTMSMTTLCTIGGFFLFILIAVGILVYFLSACPEHAAPVKENGTPNCILTTANLPPLVNINKINERDKNFTKPKLNIRLPKSVIPLKYNIFIIPSLFDGIFTFSGEEIIHVKIIEDCTNITLHSTELNILQNNLTVRRIYTMDQESYVPFIKIDIKKQYSIIEKQFYVIEFNHVLKKNSEYEIFIKFNGQISDYLQGLYKSSYEFENEMRWLASTQFQPTDARRVFPCFDEPALKANFTLNLARPKNMTTLSNMPKIIGDEKVVEGTNHYVWDKYEESFPMSTYLVAFTISDFVNITTPEGNFSVWARPNAIDSAKYALSIGPKILRNLENYFGIEFPLPKIDMIAIPDFHAGAMENWGLITYRETAMLYERGVSATTNKQRIASVVGHELAHQWFGNLVTPSWWSDIWLNEGFASYMEYLAVDDVEPQWRTLDQFVVTELQNVFQLDAMSSSHKISVEVADPDEINEIFDRISYGKGAAIIRMMSHFLTEKVFRIGLKKYLNEMAYKAAEQDDLWHFLTKEAVENSILDQSIDVKEIMDTWTLQTGFPVLSVSKAYPQYLIRIEQERFVYVHKDRKESGSLLWWVPLTFTTAEELNFKKTSPSHWIPRTKIYEIENQTLAQSKWYIFNIQQTGYYRVNYDNSNWKAITEHLLNKTKFKEISPSNRAQLIDDAMNLARGGYLSYEIALNITKYLEHEEDYVPWKAAVVGFNFIDSMFERQAEYYLMQNYLLQLLDMVYRKVSFNEIEDQDDMIAHFKRIEVLSTACHLGQDDCVSISRRNFQNWMFDPNPDRSNPHSIWI
ncbi:puromycin-sensitive aminopeptidase-like protein isoform X2 [Condylostylus longicornis]|uniref:puromycin-sensitive aminopeptidase-like protein isoform X2 n=1 Tax=Condylostylus longicornis TaxID=2530218 RepID=UPI00244E0BD5|nr:puromycin-sensitive aminopeptidase-like protein isoform X2 [Condylostylus longicornis]